MRYKHTGLVYEPELWGIVNLRSGKILKKTQPAQIEFVVFKTSRIHKKRLKRIKFLEVDIDTIVNTRDNSHAL